MDVTGLVVFLLLALPTPVLAVLKSFHLVNQLKNWTEAQSYCKQNFDDLAIIETPDDWASVTNILTQSGQTGAWIGLQQDLNSWSWSLDNTGLYERDLGSWFIFNVDNTETGDHCAETYEGMVRDYDCTYTQFPICYDETSNTFTVISTDMTWHSAQTYCRQSYTDLASLRTQQEWDTVVNMVDPNSYYWIGLFREGWGWTDQNIFSPRIWKAGEPNHGGDACGAASPDGMFDDSCSATHPIICSVGRRRKVVKVMLKTDGSVDLNDPLVQEAARKKMEEDLRVKGSPEISLGWRKQPHGEVFNLTRQ